MNSLPGLHRQSCTDNGCDGCYPAPPPPPDPALSAGQRLTVRNRALLAARVHPATRQPLAGATDEGHGHTCGDCVHSLRIHHHNKWFWKCELHRLGPSASEASDIRVSWPACTLWGPE